MKKIAFLITVCLALFFSSCEKNMYEELNRNPSNIDYKTRILDIRNIPEIDGFIKTNIGNPVYKANTINKTTITESPKMIFDKTNAIEVTDKDGNKKYTLRFRYDNTPKNIFYNLVIIVSPTGEKTSQVLKYTCDETSFIEYKNHNFSFYYFKGTMAILKTINFF